jgi:mRNA interferase MazF
MQSMISYTHGDVVLVNLGYTDRSGRKRRPAVIVSSAIYHRSRHDVIVAGITSTVTRQLIGDYLIADWQAAGLAFPSVATGILQTVQQALIGRKVNALTETDLHAYDQHLRQSLAL